MSQLPELIVHTKRNSDKRIAGFVMMDLCKEQAKAIDEYTFPKDGGWFVRAIYVEELKALLGANK